MNKFKIFLVGIFIFTLTNVNAQSSSSLLGTWEATYNFDGEKFNIDYEFTNNNQKLVCYSKYIKPENKNGEADNTLAMNNIILQNGKGKANYIFKYDGKTYNVVASLELVNSKTLKVTYSYQGYSETETWKKVK